MHVSPVHCPVPLPQVITQAGATVWGRTGRHRTNVFPTCPNNIRIGQLGQQCG